MTLFREYLLPFGVEKRRRDGNASFDTLEKVLVDF